MPAWARYGPSSSARRVASRSRSGWAGVRDAVAGARSTTSLPPSVVAPTAFRSPPSRSTTDGARNVSRRASPVSTGCSAGASFRGSSPSSQGSPASARAPCSSSWLRTCRAPGSPASSPRGRRAETRSRRGPRGSGSTRRRSRSSRVANCPRSCRPRATPVRRCSSSTRSKRCAIRAARSSLGDRRRFAGAPTRSSVSRRPRASPCSSPVT